ncbi:MAG: hypothetical protein ACXWQO_09490 [Bdellovibrionota bacterium]
MKKRWLLLVLCLCFLLAMISRHIFLSGPAPTQKVSLQEPTTFPAHTSKLREPASLPSKAADNRVTPKKIARWVSSDSYCEDSNKSFRASEGERKDPGHYMDLYRGLTLAAGAKKFNPCILAMLSRSRVEALRLSELNNDVGCRFMSGLILTGQWSIGGNTEMASDAEKIRGKEILKQLAEEEPDNGVYSLLELGSMDEGERGREEVYLTFLRGTRFENPLRPLWVELFKLGHLNPTALSYAMELTSTVGAPNFAYAYKAAREFSRQALFPSEFSDWMARLAVRFEENEKLSLSEPMVNLLEDAIQKGIAVSGASPLSPLPAILEQEGWRRYFKHRALARDLTGLIDFNAPCEVVLHGVRRLLPALVQEDERQFNLR